MISDAADVSSNGREAAFAGTVADSLQATPPTRICVTDLSTAETRVITSGPNIDRYPRFAPDGRQIGFLSDRHQLGDLQLYLLDSMTGVVTKTPRVDGWAEYLQWSSDGTRVLLGVAAHGADVAGTQGATTSGRPDTHTPSWMPTVTGRDDEDRWRSAWVYRLPDNSLVRIGRTGCNVWEASWCGDQAIVGVVSSAPDESSWYSARLSSIDLRTGEERELYQPRDQVGLPACSPTGTHIAFVEAVCSDRWLVAGDLKLIEASTGAIRHIDTRGVDVTCIEWRSDHRLLVAGHRGHETVFGVYDVLTGQYSDVWSSGELTSGTRLPAVAGLNDVGDCVLIAEGFSRGPELAVVRRGNYHTIRSFDVGYGEQAAAIGGIEDVEWVAPDGLKIRGWFVWPQDVAGPYPVVMHVHGGPVTQWRPNFFGFGRRGAHLLPLLKRGYALFLPNPRGSTGRGQDFARRVVGDMGGADAQDLLSGLDHLVRRGMVDRSRVGVMGQSYGGFMTAWLITQDQRFAAAVAVAPISNQVTAHLISNIPTFVSMFLDDVYTNPTGQYFKRSPVMYAHQAKTPTLNVCGALDRCTPPEEAVQFHRALLENGVESLLVRYPEEGHGIRKLPAAIDYTARIVAWFEKHMPAHRVPQDANAR